LARARYEKVEEEERGWQGRREIREEHPSYEL
jgi:hypothetical protein